MRISDIEVKKLLGHTAAEERTSQPSNLSDRAVVDFEDEAPYDPATDAELIAKVKADVMAMPDREDMVAELKARIEAGTYNPTGDEIADTMIRRSIADRIKG